MNELQCKMTTFQSPKARTMTLKVSVGAIAWEKCCEEYSARTSLKMCRQVNFDYYAKTCMKH